MTGKFINNINDKTVKKLKEKDTTALARVIDRYGDRLMKTAYTYCKDYHLARDVVQNVFIKLYYKIDMFEERSSLYTWLHRITVNECKSKVRKWSFRNIFYRDNMRDISDSREEVARAEKPEAVVIDNEKREQIYEQVMALRRKYRMVVYYYYYQDFSVKETAEILGEKEATIKTRLFRARKKLKKMLTGRETDE